MHTLLPKDVGWIEVICGPMFSGKTEELIRRVRRALFARQRVKIYKPRLDNRYEELAIVSHSDQRLDAEAIESASEIAGRTHTDIQVVAVDEAQFFDDELVQAAAELATSGKRVLIAGLDQDFRGAPFGPMPALLATAEYVTKTLAICVVCGNPAARSQRTTAHSDKVFIGAEESYEARCRRCHTLEPSVPTQAELFSRRETASTRLRTVR